MRRAPSFGLRWMPFVLLLAVFSMVAGAAFGQGITITNPTSTALPNATVGSRYQFQFTATGTSGVPLWTLVSGSIPPDFAFDESDTSSDGTLCSSNVPGVQTSAVVCNVPVQSSDLGATYTFTIRATDSQNVNNTTSETFTLTVGSTTTAPSITSISPLPVAQVGQAYSYQFTGTGGVPPYRWTEYSALNTFPGSFSLCSGSSTGEIGGSTPGAACSTSGLLSSPQVLQSDYAARSGGLYTFVVQMKDSEGAVSSPVQFNLTISPGLTITNSTPLPSGTLNVGYSQQLTATGGTGDYYWQIISGSLPGGLYLSTGGLISGIPDIAVSQQTFTVQVTDVGVTNTTTPPTASKTFTISIVSSQLTIIQTTLPQAYQNQAYNTTLGAQGGVPPYTWTLGTNTVSGLSIGSTTGVLSGTPTNAPGSYSITVVVTDSAGSIFQYTFSLSIAANLTISTTSLPNGIAGQAYSTTVTSGGGQGPFTWSVVAGSLPPGLTLQSSTGNSVTISGTPTTNGIYSFTVQVRDNGGRVATAALQIQIGSSVSITTTSLPNGSQGVTYNQVLGATGGQTPYTWTIVSGSLPAGLTLTTNADSTATIGGTPTGQGPSQFTVQVKDAQGNIATQAFTINIGVPLVITTVAVPNGTVGVSYSLPLGASGGTAPYSWSIISGTAPGGLTLNSTNGLLSGTPTTAGNYTFTVQVQDSTGARASRQFSMTVISQLTLSTTPVNGQVGTALSATLSASGGVPPYSYSIQSGSLPAGVSFNGSSGSFSGTPTAAGTSSVAIVVTDSTGATATATITFTIILNTPPPLTIASIAPTPAAQPVLSLTMSGTFAATLTGTLTLTFASSVGGNDLTVGFTNGTQTATFTIPAGQTAAVFSPAGLGVRTGTVAGTITIRLTQLLAGTTDVTASQSPAPQIQIVIPQSAPVITAVTCAAGTGTFTVSVTGYTTTRSMLSGTFNFTAPSGQNLQTSSLQVSLSSAFATWFATTTANATGGQFLLTMPFTTSTQSSTSGLGVSVALGNSISGSNTVSATCQ